MKQLTEVELAQIAAALETGLDQIANELLVAQKILYETPTKSEEYIARLALKARSLVALLRSVAPQGK
jgi:hypothetical protein